MRKSVWIFLVGLAALSAGCEEKQHEHVSGSGYGVGNAREAWTFGRPMSEKGSTQGVAAETERGVGMIKQAPAHSYPQAGHVLQ